MKPTIGRTVHYHFKGAHGDLVTRPAVIVQVWGDSPDSCVNLRVLYDGTNDADAPAAKEGDWKTSVLRSEAPEAGRWSWPPR
jgi:hypothetical protein